MMVFEIIYLVRADLKRLGLSFKLLEPADRRIHSRTQVHVRLSIKRLDNTMPVALFDDDDDGLFYLYSLDEEEEAPRCCYLRS